MGEKKKREFLYSIGLGIEGYVLENYTLAACNAADARDKAISRYLHPDKGYNYIEVRRLQKNQARK